MGLDMRMNVVEEFREYGMEEIEKNQEEVMDFIRNWVGEVRELFSSWISQGSSRSRSQWEKIAIQVGMLGSCLEVTMEGIEEVSDKSYQRGREIATYQALVELYLKEIGENPLNSPKKSVSPDEGDYVDSNKEESVDARTCAKTGRDDFHGVVIPELEEFEPKVEDELGIDMVDELQCNGHARANRKEPELGGEFGPESKHCGPPPWSSIKKRDGFEANWSEIKLGAIDALRVKDCAHKETDVKTAEMMPEKDAMGFNKTIKVVENYAIVGVRLDREQLAMEFEKMVLTAVHETRSENAIWVVGFNFFEPVFFLVMGQEFREPVGSPLWLDDTMNRLKSDRWEMEQAYTGPSSIQLGPSTWPYISLMDLESVNVKLRSMGPERNYEGDVDALSSDIGLLQPSESSSFQSHDSHQCNSLEPPPLPDKPPPRPPDSPLDCLRLELISTTSICPVAHGPISLRINGKADAAGKDPGDFGFHQISSSASIFDFIHSLEDKAGLKGLARAPILMEGSHTEDKSVDPRPLAEPPPHPLIDFVAVFWAFSNTEDCIWQLSGRREADSDDPGDILILQIPVVAAEFELDCSLEDKAYLKRVARAPILMDGSYVEDQSFDPSPPPPPPPKPPPIPPCDLKLIVRRFMLWIMTWYGRVRNEIGIGFTILGQLDYGILSILCKHGDKLHAGENHHDRVLALFSHSPRPPDFANDEEMEIEFQTLAELSPLYTNWEGDISLDHWKLELNLMNAQADFNIKDLLTHQSEGTLSSCTP